MENTNAWSMSNLWQGRIGAYKYFLGLIVYGAGLFLLIAVLFTIIPIPIVRVVIYWIGLILYAILTGSLVIRRCHDVGYSGWVCLVTLIPIIGWIFALYLLFASGVPETNVYGLVPSKDKKFFADILNY